MNALREARTALQRGDHATARDALVAAWRVRRSPVSAELVDVLDAKAPDAVSAQLAQIVTPRVVTTFANLKKLANLDDPRLASWTLAALANPPFRAVTAEEFLLYLGTTIDRLNDPRLDAAMPTIRGVLTARLTRKPVYTKVIRKLDAIVAKRRAIKIPAAELALERELAVLVEPLRETRQSLESLLAEVYAHPDDDGPRMVLADFLLERGDPRGEFITLQLARGRTGEPSERELELLEKYGKRWLGNLAPVLSFGKGYSGTTFVRGFVSHADFIFNIKKKVALIARDPAWATVEGLGWQLPVLIEHAPLQALRTITIDEGVRPSLERRLDTLPAVTNVAIRHHASLPPPALLRRLFPALVKLELHTLPDLAELDAYGVTELAIDLYCAVGMRTELQRAHDSFAAALPTTSCNVEHISLRPPWSTHPGPDPVLYRRGGSGYVRA